MTLSETSLLTALSSSGWIFIAESRIPPLKRKVRKKKECPEFFIKIPAFSFKVGLISTSYGKIVSNINAVESIRIKEMRIVERILIGFDQMPGRAGSGQAGKRVAYGQKSETCESMFQADSHPGLVLDASTDN